MKLTLQVWRQAGPDAPGGFETYHTEANEHMSFLEMLDEVNESLIAAAREPIAFDHDCREGICGMCSLMIDGRTHGPWAATTTCQLHMRAYHDGDTIVIEPWRANAFPVIRDLVVDRSAFDRIIASGGFITAPTGAAQDANATLVAKVDADIAMDSAACIGCGACVAACPNASAMLFTAAKVNHLARLPQGQAERWHRVQAMVNQMDEEGFGGCTNIGECEAACPKQISINNIAALNRDYLRATLTERAGAPRAAGVM